MSDVKTRRLVCVTNPEGLHLRAAMAIQKVASRFDAEVTIVNGSQSANAKEVLQTISLAAVPGTELTLEAVGPEAERVVDRLMMLFNNNFDSSDANPGN
jgi:phosphotransferase system HPr (HPr) family protein